MALKISKEAEALLVKSIKHYFDKNMDEPIGNMQAGMLLDFFMQEIAPSVYNQAIADAQAYMQEKALDMPGSCFEPEMSFWNKK
ncbi:MULTISPECIES: DUF2164 domain-containing protein [unclassified Iodobacter]|uniref:DUF2164 domain-containing protein n=1 Tax=unclassified Iodobacter TaxID=235634 RepID=UPI0025D82CDF|nr:MULTISPECIES: DUF2164 domain-containing protein [unclassified Iodobacter]MDW5415603.1 DUF2164 domain-containing protein [Iodobacter sp. CM08]